MKLEAHIEYHDDDYNAVKEVVEFEDVSEFEILGDFFIVSKMNGEVHGIRSAHLKKFSLI